MEHCKKWEAKFTHLLNTNAADEIATLYENIAKVTAAFKSKPLNLDQLADQINLLEAEQGGLEKAEGRFQPLEDMYRMLEKFEVQVKDGELERLGNLRSEWAGYRKLLTEVGTRLQKAKADFKDDLLNSLADMRTREQERHTPSLFPAAPASHLSRLPSHASRSCAPTSSAPPPSTARCTARLRR